MRLRIGQKTLLAMLGLALPSLLIFSGLTLGGAADILRRNSTRQIEDLAVHSVRALDELTRHSRATLLAISRTPAVTDYLRAAESGGPQAMPQAIARLEENFLGFQQVDPAIQAIRLLDAEGNVLVKVREGVIIPRQGAAVSKLGLAPVESLQHRDFFQGTMAIGPGEIWTSNLERGRVEGEDYWCPAMVRFSTPLFFSDGRRAGALIINVWGEAAGTLINRLLSVEEGSVFLVERNPADVARHGIYLFHQDSTCEFGNQTGSHITVFQDYPEAITAAWMGTESGTATHPDSRDLLAHLFYSPYGEAERGWVVVVNARRDVLLAPLAILKQRILLSAAAVLGLTILAAAFFARSLVRPLQSVIDGTRRLGRDLGHRIRVDSRDEVGYLAGEINRLASTLQESIAAKAQAEQQICHAEKLASVGEMASGLAHELNTPLSNIQALSALVIKELEAGRLDSEALRSDLADIAEQTVKCSAITSGLLSFARRQHPQLALHDVNRLVDEAILLVRLRREKLGIEIDFTPDPRLPYVKVDGNQLEQVLVNLLLNAFDAMPDGGVVTIRCSTDGSRVLIRVADTGVGIPPEHLRRIFDPFFTTKEVGKGTGLGLSVSYGIIQSQGGTIGVESAPGRGTVFSLHLPTGVY